MSLEVDIGFATHKGPREINEDYAAAARPPSHAEASGLIAAIADGVSTGGGGKEAAQTSVLSLVDDFHGAPDTWDTSVILDRLISAQNSWLADHNRRRQGLAQSETKQPQLAMTTLTALVLRGQSWTIAHVGDTRAWLLRGAEFVQLTQDHAFDEEFQRSRLMRAVGLDDRVRVDFEQGELRVGDVFVLTTDGVHGVVKRAQLAALARSNDDAQVASQAIVDAAVKAGSRDNATALVVRLTQLGSGRFQDSRMLDRDLPPLGQRHSGEIIDGYTIGTLLADTDVHRLYRAVTASGEQVVLKGLHESRASDVQEREMLAHEAWLGSLVAQHAPPHGEAAFIRVHPSGSQTACYIAFDWHPGATLDKLLDQMRSDDRRFEVMEIVAATIAIGRALARLHRHAVVHRDIKPGNLHLGDDGLWRVLDLGAALAGADPKAFRLLHAGTPSYMNPEQWNRDDPTAAGADQGSDVYALGVTLYEWLTGKLPYGEVEPYQTGRFRRDPKPPSRLRPDVPKWLDYIVLKAVALDCRQRFETAEELVLALERGAARPLSPRAATPLIQRDPTALWKIAFAMSLLINALLIYWLLFLPR